MKTCSFLFRFLCKLVRIVYLLKACVMISYLCMYQHETNDFCFLSTLLITVRCQLNFRLTSKVEKKSFCFNDSIRFQTEFNFTLLSSLMIIVIRNNYGQTIWRSLSRENIHNSLCTMQKRVDTKSKFLITFRVKILCIS